MFYSNVFDPWHIVFQILAMQTGFYFILGLWLFVLGSLCGGSNLVTTLDSIFSAAALDATRDYGWVIILAHCLTAPCMYVTLV